MAIQRNGWAIKKILFEEDQGGGGIEGTVLLVGMTSSAPNFEDFFGDQAQAQNFRSKDKLFMNNN